MWPKIREKFPDAELWITYGWETFLDFYRDNPERMMWKEHMDELMKQPGITHFGRVGKDKLHELRLQCGIWAYPTHFTEINCMGALECQQDGCVPVTMNLAALKETVQSGTKVEGDIYDSEVQDNYLKLLLYMMQETEFWKGCQLSGVNFVKDYTWDKIGARWLSEFK